MPEIKVMSTNGVASLLRELAPQFERATGHTLAVTWGPTNGLRKQIDQGAAFDVAILTAEITDELIKQGKVVGTRSDIARSGVGVGIRAGAHKPDIGTVEAFKRTLLAAQVGSLQRARNERRLFREPAAAPRHRRGDEA